MSKTRQRLCDGVWAGQPSRLRQAGQVAPQILSESQRQPCQEWRVIPLMAFANWRSGAGARPHLVLDPTHSTLPHRRRAGEQAARIRFQNTSISTTVSEKRIARRVIDIPNDAGARDLLLLQLIFSVDEIEDCGLYTKVLEARETIARKLCSAASGGVNTALLATLILTSYCTYADLTLLLAGNACIYFRVNIEVTIA